MGAPASSGEREAEICCLQSEYREGLKMEEEEKRLEENPPPPSICLFSYLDFVLNLKTSKTKEA